MVCESERCNNTQSYNELHQEAIEFNNQINLAGDIVKKGDMA
jgi:hypothetical protein